MRTCEICGASLELYHKSRKRCEKHAFKVKGTPTEQMISIPISLFDKWKSDSEQLTKIKEMLK